MSHPPCSIDHRTRGFTLIELLVVIAIIATLAALLLPALRNAKDTAKRSACMQHMKQVSVAVLLLADDNDGWLNGLKAATDPGGGVVPAVRWDYAMTNYPGVARLVSWQVIAGCPGISSEDSNWNPFAVNSAFAGYGYPPMHSLNEVKRPSKVFLVGESPYSFPSSYTHFDLANRGSACCGTYLKPRHGGKGLNFVFVDGHGEFLDGGIDQQHGYSQCGGSESWPHYKDCGRGVIWSD